MFSISHRSRSQALPGNVYLVALPPVSMHRWQSHRVCIPRQSLGTRLVRLLPPLKGGIRSPRVLPPLEYSPIFTVAFVSMLIRFTEFDSVCLSFFLYFQKLHLFLQFFFEALLLKLFLNDILNDLKLQPLCWEMVVVHF